MSKDIYLRKVLPITTRPIEYYTHLLPLIPTCDISRTVQPWEQDVIWSLCHVFGIELPEGIESPNDLDYDDIIALKGAIMEAIGTQTFEIHAGLYDPLAEELNAIIDEEVEKLVREEK